MIDTNVLRKKIIDLAIAGKLTDHTSGNASEELDKIIKTLNNSEQRYISDDEKWISIPSNWTWGRLVDLTTNSSLNDGDWVLSKDMVSEGPVKLIQLGSIGDCEYRYKGFKYLTEEHFNELNGKQIYPGYLLINRLVVNKMLSCIIPKMNGILMTAVDVCWVAPNDELYNLEYLMYVLSSTGVQQKVKELGHGVTRFRISKLNLIDIAFPLPPINEQQQIVDIVNELFSILKRIDDLQSSYVADYESLKNKAIEAGVYGKLTKQLPEDGTAEELYQYIQEKKNSLIISKRIKKDKSVLEVKEEEVPFDIPDNWKWVRWGEIVNIVSARRVHQSDWRKEGIPFYRAREIAKLADNGFVDNDLYISEELYDEFSKSGVPCDGDLMVSAVGTLGKTYVVKESDHFYYKDASVLCFENFAGVDPYYLRYVMNSDMMNKQIESNSGGTTVDTLTMVRMIKYLLPLPPLQEQHRIVEKIDSILSLIA